MSLQIMNFPKPQPWQDWLTQWWNILLGKPCTSEDSDWLLGPISETTEIGYSLIHQIAQRENLSIDETSSRMWAYGKFRAF